MAVKCALSAKQALMHLGRAASLPPSIHSSSKPNKFALLIGCQYKDSKHHAELFAPHRDVFKFKTLLIKVYHYEEANITVLLDDGKHERPTKANIVKAMKKLVEGTKATDQLFLHFSGHGNQTPCEPDDKTEPDGMDEAIVPCDATDDKETWIIDNDMNKLLVRKIPVDAQLIALFDMCHSGTALDLKHYYTDQGVIHVCKRTSHDKVENESRKLNQLPGRLTTAASDSQGNATRQRVRQYSFTSRKNTVHCELSEGSEGSAVQRADTDARQGTDSQPALGPEQEQVAFVPERPIRQSSAPHPSVEIDGPAEGERARRHSDLLPRRCKDGCLSTLHLTWLPLPFRRVFSKPGRGTDEKISSNEDGHSLPPRVSTSTSITPLITPASSPSPVALAPGVRRPMRRSKSIAPVVAPIAQLARMHPDRRSTPAVLVGAAGLDSIDENHEAPPSSSTAADSDLILGIERTMSPTELDRPPSLHGYATNGTVAETSVKKKQSSSPMLQNRINCKDSLPGKKRTHGQVITIAVAHDEQLSWETSKGSLTSALVEILEKDAHPTYRNLKNSLQIVLNEVSDDFRRFLTHEKKKVYMKIRRNGNQKKVPLQRSASVSRQGSTRSWKSGDDVGQDLFKALERAIPNLKEMDQTVEQANGGPIQEPMFGAEIHTDLYNDTFNP